MITSFRTFVCTEMVTLGMKGLITPVKTPSLSSDMLYDQNSPPVEAEVFFPQGFFHPVLCLPPVLISLVSCPQQREQMGDVESKIGLR